MPMKPDLLFDVDGVLADFSKLYVEVCNDLFGTHFTESDTVGSWHTGDALGLTEAQDKAIFGIVKNRGLDIKPMLGAVEAIREVCRIGNVFFVTSPIYEGAWVNDRVSWVEKTFPFLPVAPGESVGDRVLFVKAHYKYKVAGDFFIDDKASTVQAWERYWSHRPVMARVAPGGRAVDWDTLIADLHEFFGDR